MSSAKIDAILRGLRQFGPYGIFLGFGGLSWALYGVVGTASAGVRLDTPSKIMRWCGALLAIFTLVGVVLWHFWQWPPWLNQLPVGSPCETQVEETGSQRCSCALSVPSAWDSSS